jgi:16S rRNA (guanine966-N2)-methyltransferase
MSRIISGLAGSLRLAQGARDTRPTSDRVKESLFAVLESADLIAGASVLDLLAGTGALGLEALSRGAKRLTLVEKARGAFEVCEKNAASVKSSLERQGLGAEIKLKNSDALAFLESADDIFDLVFVDPPYEFADEKLSAVLEQLVKNLSDQAVVIVERSARSEGIALPELEVFTERDYGDTRVSFFRRFAR